MDQQSKDYELARNKKTVSFFHSPIAAWTILFLSLALTISAYHISQDFIYKKASNRFNFRSKEIHRAVHERMMEYEQVLRGGVGLFDSIGIPTRSQFQKYVSTLRIADFWPGIQGMGFSIPIKPTEKDSHIASIRSEGFPEYTIKPPGERDLYSAIIYLEPFDWRNKRAFGYDMWSNEMRRQAMKNARDKSLPTTSGLITLVQETKSDIQKGFLTYLPVYKNNKVSNSTEDKKSAFVGWVYAAFRMNDLMKGILGSIDSDINFEIYDGTDLTEDHLLFSTSNISKSLPNNQSSEFSTQMNVELQSRNWVIKFSSKPNYIKPSDTQQANIVLITGIIIDLLLFYVIYSIYFLQKRAESIARGMTNELHKNEAKLIKAKVLAEKASESKSMFLANISHELRTPLNSIVVLSDLLSKNKNNNLTTEQLKFSKTVYNCGKDLTHLIDDILDIAKVDYGEIVLNNEVFDSKEIVSKLKYEFEQLAKQKSIDFKITIDSSFPDQIEHDFVKLHQILKNLFSNAIKFTSEGGVSAHLYRPTEKILFKNKNLNTQNTLAFSITDTGIGIVENQFEEIFEDFHQADGSTTRNYAGTGLGLSISKKLSEALGGEIQLTSKKGGGSTFTLYLQEILGKDVTNNKRITEQNNANEEVIKSNLTKLNGKSFLLVDDKHENILSLSAILNEHKVKLNEAFNGKEAIAAIEKNTYDLVLMDMMMPIMGGLEAIGAIRRMEGCKSLPVIVVTARAMSGDKEKCINAGADDYISKPIDSKILLSKIEKLL